MESEDEEAIEEEEIDSDLSDSSDLDWTPSKKLKTEAKVKKVRSNTEHSVLLFLL